MGLKETIEAWLQPKDLSLILEIEPTPKVMYPPALPGFPESSLSEGPSALSVAASRKNMNFYFQHFKRLEQEYSEKYLVIIDGNETNDGKTRFYVAPVIRGKTGNITWDELKTFYPQAVPLGIYLEGRRDFSKPKMGL